MSRIIRVFVMSVLTLAFFAGVALAADVALTSVGQSPDAMMAKVVLKKMKVDVDFDALMKPDALAGHKVLIAVVGGSSKGLGAAGIDKDQEKGRSVELIQAARDAGIKVLVMHVGGAGRRGTLSDLFIGATVPMGDRLIMVQGANHDGFFDTLIEGRDIPVDVAPTIRAIDVPMKKALVEWGVLTD